MEDDLVHSEEAQKRWAQTEKYAADLRKASSAGPPKMRAKYTSRCFKILVVRAYSVLATLLCQSDPYMDHFMLVTLGLMKTALYLWGWVRPLGSSAPAQASMVIGIL